MRKNWEGKSLEGASLPLVTGAFKGLGAFVRLNITVSCEPAALRLAFALFFGTRSRIFEFVEFLSKELEISRRDGIGTNIT